MQKQFEDFMEMTEEERIEKGQQMSNEEKDMIMKAAAQTNGTAVNDNMATIGEEGGRTSTIYNIHWYLCRSK
ncbi:MAG: hypothetical protein M3286_03235 [Thermoproteota archaeon]|nr:hypothetical protein [Thermoproteota archaeon]